MKDFLKYLTILFLLLFLSCSSNNVQTLNEVNIIEIGNYKFEFPTGFDLIEQQGIDSYVGTIVRDEITLSFDYGWYTSPLNNLPEDEYIITEDEINGHYRQIVKPINSELNYTRIHLYKIIDSLESPNGYNSLTLLTYNLTTTEQELVLTIFNSVEIIE